ncbi:SDR family NAD(P)-dependent oxidoreductase [Falsibacillus albus]|uniref:SDR family NAD(P)-dependent oxidoreductase n=1 Tax=Falsibacillus albus TaxID=2478915 RepID=A0A3L7JU05_9BACI|nr:SDR family NAD(P)-dependent oxidoreductase [Falsibacillus albus]RLQ94206.1 SDR family NAD(P)-dependent oxidoreductase [Falsibacillus albus]
MTNKVMLIVGAGPGVSLNAAKRFGREGFKVALIARRRVALNNYVEELQANGVEAKGFVGDISSDSSLKLAIQEAAESYGRIDVLLYNAASGKPTDLTSDDLAADFQISVGGALTAVKEVVPKMNKGAILLTGGGLALHPFADYSSLAIGKAGIRNLAYSLHQELKEKGIYVGTLTINGFVQKDTFYSAENIADEFFSMFKNRKDIEVLFEENKKSTMEEGFNS